MFTFFVVQVAVPDLLEATKGADILVFVLPHQFVNKICDTLKNNIKKSAIGVSLIKVENHTKFTNTTEICVLNIDFECEINFQSHLEFPTTFL